MKSGLCFKARKVVIATGLTCFRRIPESLSHLPSDKLWHSADVHDFQRFSRRPGIGQTCIVFRF
jgi:hypothetical protein